MSPRAMELWRRYSKDLTWEWRVTEEHLDDGRDGDTWTIRARDPKYGKMYGCRIFVPHDDEILHGTLHTLNRTIATLVNCAADREQDGNKPFELLVAEELMKD